MKKRFLSICAVALSVAFVACTNNEGSTSATGDSTSTATTNTTTTDMSTTTSTSETSYAAMADSIERNSQSGYYLNPKTGKPYKSLKVDRSTGAIMDDAGQEVSRYVDNRNWWVYGDDNYDDNMYSWNQVGEAKMDQDKVMYKGDGDKWVDYDTRYKADDENWIKKHKVSDNGMKEKIVTEDGDKMKIKTDEEGNTKIKVNGEKTKISKDGEVKKN